MTHPKDHISDFTEANYRRFLQLGQEHWRFISYTDYRQEGRNCLWRHDVDASPQRGLRLAQIEAEVGVQSTYFIHLHSMYYNPLEKETATVIRQILALGHYLGLHFDSNFYQQVCGRDKDRLMFFLRLEKDLLEGAFANELTAFSFHDPDAWSIENLAEDEVLGMVNAYGNVLRLEYSYVSDSNGYWRHRSLPEVLQSRSDERLQVLTHPEWWCPEALSPRDRISRCIDGRAAWLKNYYDKTLEEIGRVNVR